MNVQPSAPDDAWVPILAVRCLPILTPLQLICQCFQLGGHDLELIRKRRLVLRHFE